MRLERAPIEEVIPLVTRALQVLSEREVAPQMGLLKTTLLQLDSTFSERDYGAGSFRDFVQKLEKVGVVKVHQGKGGLLVSQSDGTPMAVINLLGKLFLDPAVSPFAVAEELVAAARREADLVLVDFHAEATSEKVAMGRFLDGSVTAVVGTHTHVQTSDAHVLSGGTAYITDAGMTGPHDSVIGVRTDLILRRFTTQMPVRFEPADGGVRLEGVVIECDGAGRASSIEAIRIAE